MKRILLFAYCATILISCNFFEKKKQPVATASEELYKIMDTDKAFSKMSEEKGMKSAFLEYMDPDGVLLRPGHYPIVGGNAVSFLTGTVDTSFTLTWEPTDGKIAKSGDLGFTYGTYKLQPKIKDSAVYGTYVSVWKKQENGEWKFVLDTGNEGVGDEKE